MKNCQFCRLIIGKDDENAKENDAEGQMATYTKRKYVIIVSFKRERCEK